MAMVPTGKPPGICTVASRASRPASGVAASGTPITGMVVRAARAPARWAAAPAPAMIARTPFSRAEAASAAARSGVRCAE